MKLPETSDLLLPMLEIMRDGNEYHLQEISKRLAQRFDFSQTGEIKDRTLDAQFYSRVVGARSYMTQALLLESTRRGVSKISERGQELLEEDPQTLTINSLTRYPEFLEYLQSSTSENLQEYASIVPKAQNGASQSNGHTQSAGNAVAEPPEAELDNPVEEKTDNVEKELSADINESSPNGFEASQATEIEEHGEIPHAPPAVDVEQAIAEIEEEIQAVKNGAHRGLGDMAGQRNQNPGKNSKLQLHRQGCHEGDEHDDCVTSGGLENLFRTGNVDHAGPCDDQNGGQDDTGQIACGGGKQEHSDQNPSGRKNGRQLSFGSIFIIDG